MAVDFSFLFFFSLYHLPVSKCVTHASKSGLRLKASRQGEKKKMQRNTKLIKMKPEVVKEDWNWHLASVAGGRVQPENWRVQQWVRRRTNRETPTAAAAAHYFSLKFSQSTYWLFLAIEKKTSATWTLLQALFTTEFCFFVFFWSAGGAGWMGDYSVPEIQVLSWISNFMSKVIAFK